MGIVCKKEKHFTQMLFCDGMPRTLFFLLLNWLSFRFDSSVNIRDAVHVGAIECHFLSYFVFSESLDFRALLWISS